MKIKTLIAILFVLPMTGFSQKIEKKDLTGKWIMKDSFGGSAISLYKFSEITFDPSFFMATTIFFKNDNTFGTGIFSGEACAQGVFCFLEGSWKLDNNQIEFFKIKNEGNGVNCKFPSTTSYEIVAYTNKLLALKKMPN